MNSYTGDIKKKLNIIIILLTGSFYIIVDHSVEYSSVISKNKLIFQV